LVQPFAAGLRGVNPSRALLSLLSNRSYVGDVEIGERAASQFQPKASREGFVENEAFEQLRDIIRFGIDWSTIYREYFRGLSAQGEAEKAREELEVQLREPVEPKDIINSAIRLVESEVKSLATRLPTAERQQILRSIKTATAAISKHEESNSEERRHLQLVASTSTLLLIFSHEVKSLLSWFEQVRISIDAIREKVSEPESTKLAGIQDEFGDTKERLIDLLSMTSLISVTRRSQPARITLASRLNRAIRSFDLICKKYKININTENVSSSLQVGPMLEAELLAILLNVLSNSIKSVIAEGGKRQVMVTAERHGSKAVINILDTGVGLEPKLYEEVFNAFSSDPSKLIYDGLKLKLNLEDEYILGTGSGLGLSIAREILANRGGTIRFIQPNSPWKANIEIKIP